MTVFSVFYIGFAKLVQSHTCSTLVTTQSTCSSHSIQATPGSKSWRYLCIGGNAGAGSDSAVTWEDRKTQKACLERYRVASAEILAVFHEVAPDANVEKASIDEAYLDVTSIVDAHLQASTCCPASPLTYTAYCCESLLFPTTFLL